MALKRGPPGTKSRARRIASSTRFSSIALPICTAWANSSACVSVSSAEEKVAPWIPSRPVRPPSAMIRSPGLASPLIRSAGITPTHPQKTRGFPMYRSSNQTAPFSVGMPMRLP